MNDYLATEYLGLKLPHPIVVGASPLVQSLDQVRAIEDAGASALVMHSLFEEQVLADEAGVQAHVTRHGEAFAEAPSYFPAASDYALGPDDYLEQIRKIKEIVSMPVIGSLNGRTPGGWIDFARDIEAAGADALELNLYFQPTEAETTAAEIEAEAVEIVRAVRGHTQLPLSVKLSPYFTALPAFVRAIHEAGADGMVLFNRFYQPDIDIEELDTLPSLRLSNSSELLLRLRWLAILHGRMPLSMACSGGVHTVEDVIKATMAGADCVQMVSRMLREGPAIIPGMVQSLRNWMEEHEYTSLAQMKGSLSYRNTPHPEAIERANYLKILQSWKV
jgi:dihydroorotate dehydrogenase (fumarate)